jgi:hypothetical protein
VLSEKTAMIAMIALVLLAGALDAAEEACETGCEPSCWAFWGDWGRDA